MNGEIRIWDVRAPDSPLYEAVAQPTGLQSLAVHTAAPVLATSSAPAGHATRQKVVIQGFADPEHPKKLSTIAIPLSPYAPRVSGFMPSASSMVFHPVSCPPIRTTVADAQTEMVLGIGGGDASGTVRLFKCDMPAGFNWETANGFH